MCEEYEFVEVKRLVIEEHNYDCVIWFCNRLVFYFLPRQPAVIKKKKSLFKMHSNVTKACCVMRFWSMSDRPTILLMFTL